MKKKETKAMRQVKIYEDDARFVEYIIAIEGTKGTFATMFHDALREKYGDKWESFAKAAGIEIEKGKKQ